MCVGIYPLFKLVLNWLKIVRNKPSSWVHGWWVARRLVCVRRPRRRRRGAPCDSQLGAGALYVRMCSGAVVSEEFVRIHHVMCSSL
jgi:hypothetical protein